MSEKVGILVPLISLIMELEALAGQTHNWFSNVLFA